MRGISDVIAEVILVAVAIAISIAVAGWLMGVWSGASKPEVYYHYVLSLNYVGDSAYQPIPGVARIEVWSENLGGGESRVYVRVTALKNLAYIRVTATIKNATGDPPTYVGSAYSSVTWEDTDVPSGYYSERYWSPILNSEYPVHVELHVFVREK